MPLLPRLPDLTGHAPDLARTIVSLCLMPHPDVVAAFPCAIFPTLRASKTKPRLTVETVEGRRLMYDDNTTPRWAILWAHGISATHHPKGWTFAHVWGVARDPDAYTHLGNLLMMPEAFASLSDKDGPLCPYLRHHAETVYGWRPRAEHATPKPEGYDALTWRYLDPVPDPIGFVRQRLHDLNNQRAKLIRDIRASNA